jgi:hypothetical protein
LDQAHQTMPMKVTKLINVTNDLSVLISTFFSFALI